MKYEEIWQKAKNIEMAASPYLKARVMAHIAPDRKLQRQLWFWRFSTGVTFAGLLFVLVFRMDTPMPKAEVAAVNQNYVFHVNFSDADLGQAQIAEIELPDGVKFVSKSNPVVNNLKVLRLPIHVSESGTNKLPFVIKAVKPGRHQLAIRLYNQENKLMREKQFTVNFTNLAQSEVF